MTWLFVKILSIQLAHNAVVCCSPLGTSNVQTKSSKSRNELPIFSPLRHFIYKEITHENTQKSTGLALQKAPIVYRPGPNFLLYERKFGNCIHSGTLLNIPKWRKVNFFKKFCADGMWCRGSAIIDSTNKESSCRTCAILGALIWKQCHAVITENRVLWMLWWETSPMPQICGSLGH